MTPTHARHSTRTERDVAVTDARATADESQPEKADSGDIVDVLRDQHDRIRQLFGRVQTAPAGDRTRLVGELDRFLHAHEAGEQVVVHPVLRDQVVGGAASARARVVEEARLEASIAALVDSGVDHPAFVANVAALQRVVFDHLDREERDEFPQLRRFVPAQHLYSMANYLRNLQAMR